MSSLIKDLEPKKVFEIFDEILKIPRPSGNEKNIASFIVNYANNIGCSANTDENGNVIIDVPATKGKENCSLVILQGHMDMVCVQTDSGTHDFLKDPINAYIDGDFIRAKGTTLGADNGIAIAMVLALLQDKNVEHGPLRAIFTVEEETTMKGATTLSEDALKGDYLINLDSEDNGYLFVSCAGSMDVSIKYAVERIKTENTKALRIELSDLSGGHSGADIHKGHANAIKVLSCVLDNLSDDYDIFLKDIQGGLFRNSIPTKAHVEIEVSNDEYDAFVCSLNECIDAQKKLYKNTDPKMNFTVSDAENGMVLGLAQSLDFIHFLRALPDGMTRMSPVYENIVETSVNTGIIKSTNECISISMLPRSLSKIGLDAIIANIRAVCCLTDNADMECSNEHLPWESPSDNKLIRVLDECYHSVTGKNFKITALHAGVECAQFVKKNKKLQLISLGPTILNPHSVMERMDIKGVLEIYSTVTSALKKLQ